MEIYFLSFIHRVLARNFPSRPKQNLVAPLNFAAPFVLTTPLELVAPPDLTAHPILAAPPVLAFTACSPSPPAGPSSPRPLPSRPLVCSSEAAARGFIVEVLEDHHLLLAGGPDAIATEEHVHLGGRGTEVGRLRRGRGGDGGYEGSAIRLHPAASALCTGLLDFACFKLDSRACEACECPRERFMRQSVAAGCFTEENLTFQQRILERSGLGLQRWA